MTDISVTTGDSLETPFDMKLVLRTRHNVRFETEAVHRAMRLLAESY